MPSEIVFSNAQAVIARSFLDKMPCHIPKDDFFGWACKTYNIVFDKNRGSECFSFEGLWKDLVCMENFLKEHLLQWNVRTDIAKSENEGCDKSTSCDQLDRETRQTPSPGIRNKDCESSMDSIIKNSLNAGQAEQSSVVCSYSTVINCTDNKEVVEESSTSVPESQKCKEVIENLETTSIGLSTDTDITEKEDQDLNSASSDKNSLSHENEIYMDIQLSCRPSYGLFRDGGTTPVMVVMRTEESLMEAVLESKNRKTSFKHVVETVLTSVQPDQDKGKDWRKARSKGYEEKANYKYFCSQCSFKTKRSSHLRKHALLHEQVCKLYSCDHCDFSTIRLGHLQRHVMQHSELQLSCPVCNYKTHSKTLLHRHQNIKHKVSKQPLEEERPELHCTECSYTTTREKLFQRHQAVHSRSKNTVGGKNFYDCTKCSFKTTTKSNLARHSNNIHNGERPFLCNVCGQGFKRSDTLTQHLVIHASSDSSIDDLQCPHCHKFYRSKSLLHEHILVHSVVRSYLCEMCGAAFKTRAVQRKHVRMVHVNSQLYPCNHCSKKFNSKFAVKRHMKLHEPKTAPDTSAEGKPSENSGANVSDQWTNPVVTLPVTEDVQVLVVQDSTQQGIMFNDGAIFIQDATQVPVGSPSKAVNVPILPVEYVLPVEVMATQICTNTNLGTGTQFTTQDGEIITLQFVQ